MNPSYNNIFLIFPIIWHLDTLDFCGQSTRDFQKHYSQLQLSKVLYHHNIYIKISRFNYSSFLKRFCVCESLHIPKTVIINFYDLISISVDSKLNLNLLNLRNKFIRPTIKSSLRSIFFTIILKWQKLFKNQNNIYLYLV